MRRTFEQFNNPSELPGAYITQQQLRDLRNHNPAAIGLYTMPLRTLRKHGRKIRRINAYALNAKIKALAKATRPELKIQNFDMTTVSTVGAGTAALEFNNTGFVNQGTASANAMLLNGISEGDDNTNREGRVIKMVRVSIKAWANHQAAAGTFAACRLVLLYDRQSNGVAPAFTNIWTATSGNATWASQINTNSAGRYKILLDRMFYTVGDTSMDGKAIKINIRFKRGLRTLYNASGATIAQINQGALYLITMGNQNSGAAAATVLTGTARMRYTDV